MSVPETFVIKALEAQGLDLSAKRVRDLVAENAALRADRDRLTWLESRKHEGRAWVCNWIGPPDLTTEACKSRLHQLQFFTARAALDAAMAAEKSE